MLELRNLSFEYEMGLLFRKKIKVLDNLSLKIKKNETYFLLGESGSGKTTLAKIILGILKPKRGKIYFEGEDLESILKYKKKFFRKYLQYIPQHPEAFFDFKYTILDFLLEPRYIYKDLNYSLDTIKRFLKNLNIKENVLEKYPHELSGGELQRILIIRSLLLNPKFLILDESLSMLDVLTQAEILNFLLDYKKQNNITYLFITHDVDIAYLNFPNKKVAILYKGKILEEGSNILKNPKNLYTKEFIKKFYFGEKKWI